MTPEDHEKQHRFSEIVVIMEDYIEKHEKQLEDFKRELLWWKERTKKELELEDI